MLGAQAVAASLSLTLAAAGAPERPAFRLAEGRLHLATLPDVLADPQVEPHLRSGLTTSFLFKVSARDAHGARAEGAALIEIRWELWDEVFLAARTDLRGERERASLASLADLRRWWREPDLALLVTEGLAATDPWQVRVELSVLPFSGAEHRDTQEWFRRSFDASREGAAAGIAEVAPRAPLRLSEVLTLLMATSIARESVVTFHWSAVLAPAS